VENFEAPGEKYCLPNFKPDQDLIKNMKLRRSQINKENQKEKEYQIQRKLDLRSKLYNLTTIRSIGC